MTDYDLLLKIADIFLDWQQDRYTDEDALLLIQQLTNKKLIAEFITRLEMIADEDDLYKTKEYYEKKLQEGEA